MKKITCFSIIIIALAGCATSPDPTYYTLAPVNGTVMPDVTYIIKIQRPSLPRYLDTPNIVSQKDSYQMEIDENHRWAEPLDTMFERILADDLRERLPKATVILQDDDTFHEPRVTIAMDIQQFNRTGGKVALQAQLTIQDRGTHEQPRPQNLQYASDTDSSVSAAAGDLSALMGKAADEIALILRDQVIKSQKATSPSADIHIEK